MRFWLGLALITLTVGGGSGSPGQVRLQSQFPFRKQTEYFDFHYRRDTPSVSDLVRFGDGFIRELNRDFFKAEFDYPIHAFILTDQHEYEDFVHSQLRISESGDFGIYVYSNNVFATYEDSGLGTFTHEILYPLVERNLSARPPWAEEGIPTFFEKFYGYWENDELVLFWGYQNPWRINELGASLINLDLPAIVSDDPRRARDQSQLRIVCMFLWERGEFRRFLRLLAAKDRRGYPSYLEAAMEMPMTRIIPLWKSYLQEVARHRTEILSLPVSTVFDSKRAFEGFAKSHGLPTRQVGQRD
jgi:hypothetical protein